MEATHSPQRSVTVRFMGVSNRVKVYPAAVTVIVAAATFAVFVWSLSFGTPDISPLQVIELLAGGGDPALRPILFQFRLARGMSGILAGCALGISGVIFQRVARNPLATPDLMGVTTGATMAAALAIVTFGLVGPLVSVFAVVGGLMSAALIYLLGRGSGGVSGYRLVLVGVGLTFMFTSLTAYLVSRATLFQAQTTITLLVGSLATQDWTDVQMLGFGLAVLVPAALVLARTLSALELGDDHATGLGAHRERATIALLAVGAGLAALAAGACGPVAFVALLGALAARRLTRDATTGFIPAAAVGALMVTSADLIARNLGPRELPVGVITAAIGGPFLMLLLLRTNRSGEFA